MKLLPILALLIAAGQNKPAAAPPELGSTVQAAPVGDLFGPWQAFAVELDNRSKRDLDLLIRIEDESYLSVATRTERLSPGARKRVFLYSAAGIFPRGVAARYRITDASGRELASGQLPIANRSYAGTLFQVGIFAFPGATDEDFGIPNSVSGTEVRYGRLTEATFPDRWIGLAALDILLIHEAKLDELNADQARALSDYVRQGGTVVISQGPAKGWISHPVLAAFAPARTSAPKEVRSLKGINDRYGPFRAAQPFIASPLLNGDPFKPGLDGEIVRLNAGFGRTYVLGFDLFRAPFDTWIGRRALWQDLLTETHRGSQEDRSAFPNASNPGERSALFGQMARLINPYPPFELILGLAVVFLIIVGPLNYLFLWRLQRTLLLVVTVPAISFAFLGFIFVLGYVLKGTTTVVHSARLLSTRSGMDCAREIHLYSLFSPSTRTYDAACESGTYALPPGHTARWDERYGTPRRTSEVLTIDNAGGLTIRGLGAGQWQSWELEAQALRELGKGVRFEVQGRRLTVTNGSGRLIERGVYVETGAAPVAAGFGEIAAGKAVDVEIPAPGISPLTALGLKPDSLGDRLLHPWLAPRVPGPRTERYLICVLRDDDAPIRVDARISDRSRSITLLHVKEAP